MVWNEIKLKEVLFRKKDLVEIQDDKEYKLVTIRLHHKGVVLREIKKGSELKSSKMAKIKSGDFVLSGIDARNGAFGIVPPELDGALISNDFWCLDLDGDKLDKNFFYFLTTTPFFDFICKQASDGTTQRIRLQKEKFFNYKIELPSKDEQLRIFKRLKWTKEKVDSIESELTHQQSLLTQLRQAILQEAVQGKLVPQHLDDEPAGVLLERIRAEKAKLLKEGKIKKSKPLPPIRPEEVPFALPEGWVWCRLGEIVNDFISGFAFESSRYVKYSRNQIIRLGNVKNNNLYLSSNPVFIDDEYAKEAESFQLKENDLLITMTGTRAKRDYLFTLLINNSCLKDTNLYLNQRVGCIRFFKSIDESYVNLCLKVEAILAPIFETATGAANQANIGVMAIKSTLIPLPPLAEQRRIVARVQQLLGWCGQLEQQVQESRGYAGQLLQAVLQEAFGRG